jgi:hypothetical protein
MRSSQKRQPRASHNFTGDLGWLDTKTARSYRHHLDGMAEKKLQAPESERGVRNLALGLTEAGMR